MLDETLDAAQARRAGKQAHPRRHRHRRVASAPHLDGQHPAGQRHLPLGNLIAGVRRQPGIVDALDTRMLAQELGHAARVLAVGAHADSQCRDAALDEPAVEGRGDAATVTLDEPHALEEFVVLAGDEDAAGDIGVAAQVLGGRVHGDVRAQVQRPLEDRRGPGVVAHQARSHVVGQVGDGGDIGDTEQGVGGRLGPDQASAGAQGGFDLRQVRHVHKRRLQPPRPQNLAQNLGGPVVGIVGGNDMVARLERLADGKGGGRPRCKGQPRRAAFERRQPRFERPAIGVVGAGIDVAVGEGAVLRPFEGRGQVDGGRDCARGRVGVMAGVDGQGFEMHGVSFKVSFQAG